MSYVLINGKRHYKDDRTGDVSIDNVSQDTADRRSRQRYIPPPLPQPPPSPPTATRTQPPHRSGPVPQFVSLLHRILRTATVSVAVGSVLLIGAYCLKEPVQFQAEFRYELRNTRDMAERAEQVRERWTELLETERG